MLKLALSLLIWPTIGMAQDPPPTRQPDPPPQSPVAAQDLIPAPTAPTEANRPAPIPAPVKPALVHFRPLSQTTVPAGYLPLFNFSAGYSVIALGLGSPSRVAVDGMNASISFDPNQRFGARLDLGYARASNVFSSGHGASVLDYLVGPVFYLSERNPLSTYAEVLVGGAKVVGVVPVTNAGLSIGQVHYPAWAFGGGAEYRFSPAFGFRLNADYLHTHFYNSSGVVHGQHDLRIVNSIVFYPGTHR